MKKTLLLFTLLLSLNSFCTTHTYSFKIVGITTYGDAKLMIEQMRSILGIKMFIFDDSTDTFITRNPLEFNWDDMSEDLAQHNIFIDGPITHEVDE